MLNLSNFPVLKESMLWNMWKMPKSKQKSKITYVPSSHATLSIWLYLFPFLFLSTTLFSIFVMTMYTEKNFVVHSGFKNYTRGTWMAQSVDCPTSAQVMISWFVSSSLTSDLLLSAESATAPLSPSLCPFPDCALSLSKINIINKYIHTYIHKTLVFNFVTL